MAATVEPLFQMLAGSLLTTMAEGSDDDVLQDETPSSVTSLPPQEDPYANYGWLRRALRWYPPVFASIGISGNILIIVTLIRCRRRLLQPLPAYCYLLALAVSDLLYLVSVLVLSRTLRTMTFHLPDPDWYYGKFCAYNVVVGYTASYASVWTVVAFSVERYIAICHPFRNRVGSSLKTTIKVIMAVWLVSFLLALPYHWLVGSRHLTRLVDGRNVTGDWCRPIDRGVTFTLSLSWISTIFHFLAPFTLTSVFAIQIVWAIRMSRSRVKTHARFHPTSQTTLSYMLVLLSSVALVLLMPIKVLKLYMYFKGLAPTSPQITLLWHSFTLLFDMNSCLNFCLYYLASRKFRKALKAKVFCCLPGEKLKRPSTLRSGAKEYGGIELKTIASTPGPITPPAFQFDQ
ncbi:GHSR [Branchiostoma lanceolatum]|uniref:GHSR protein n=1 Tax=Branchiostoma lanceolatum TaxID=7740 RepID=A0A8K0EIA8_BRALA|nr:GHSR [Branchiostoma lanceolatum]